MHQTAQWAIEECRRGQGPALIEAITYRLVAHTSTDDDRRYRPRAEVEEWARNDPILRLRSRLLDGGALTEQADERLRAEIKREIDEAVGLAEQAADVDPATALRHVFYEGEPD